VVIVKEGRGVGLKTQGKTNGCGNQMKFADESGFGAAVSGDEKREQGENDHGG